MKYFSEPDNDKLPIGTAYWVKYIRDRIKKNQNFMGCFIGQTGTGKSYSCISLAELIQDGFIDNDNVFFKATDFLKRLMLGNLPKGTVLVWDEAGKDLNSKNWQAKANRVVSVVFQIFRRENIIVLFTLPYFSFLDPDARKLVHATFETQGIDRNNKETTLKPLLIQVNQDTGKMYKKFLRVFSEEKGLIPVQRIRLPMPNEEFLKEYEKRKEEFSKQTYKEAYEALLELESAGNPTEEERIIDKMDKEGKKQRDIAEYTKKSVQYISKKLKVISKMRDKGLL